MQRRKVVKTMGSPWVETGQLPKEVLHSRCSHWAYSHCYSVEGPSQGSSDTAIEESFVGKAAESTVAVFDSRS